MGSGARALTNGHLEGSFRPGDLPVTRQEHWYLSDRLVGAHALRPAGCCARPEPLDPDQASGEVVLFHQGWITSEAPGTRSGLSPGCRSDRRARIPRQLELSVPHRIVGRRRSAQTGSLMHAGLLRKLRKTLRLAGDPSKAPLMQAYM